MSNIFMQAGSKIRPVKLGEITTTKAAANKVLLNNVSTHVNFNEINDHSSYLPRQKEPHSKSPESQNSFILNPTISYTAPVRHYYPSSDPAKMRKTQNMNMVVNTSQINR